MTPERNEELLRELWDDLWGESAGKEQDIKILAAYGERCRAEERAQGTADRAAAVDLVRELREALERLHPTPRYVKPEEKEVCVYCCLLARAAAYLRGERSSGAGAARLQLQNALAVVTLLKLARGRMQHIVETATAAMTHAEVRMTIDLIAQIDGAFNPDVPPAPKAEEEGR